MVYNFQLWRDWKYLLILDLPQLMTSHRQWLLQEQVLRLAAWRWTCRASSCACASGHCAWSACCRASSCSSFLLKKDQQEINEISVDQLSRHHELWRHSAMRTCVCSTMSHQLVRSRKPFVAGWPATPERSFSSMPPAVVTKWRNEWRQEMIFDHLFREVIGTVKLTASELVNARSSRTSFRSLPPHKCEYAFLSGLSLCKNFINTVILKVIKTMNNFGEFLGLTCQRRSWDTCKQRVCFVSEKANVECL